MEKYLNRHISTRQLMAIVTVALMAPASGYTPMKIAEAGAQAAWLAPLPGFIILCIIALPYRTLLRSRADGEGLAEVYYKIVGKIAGKIIVCFYALWSLMLATLTFRMYGERFVVIMYRSNPIEVYIIMIALLVMFILWRKLTFFARTAQVFMAFTIMVIITGCVTSFSNLNYDYVLPVSKSDAIPVIKAGIMFFDGCALAFFAAFLAGYINKDKYNEGVAFRWMALFCIAWAAQYFILIGNFSSPLVSRLPRPFASLVGNTGSARSSARSDAILHTVWMFTDISCAALACFIAKFLIKSVFELKKAKATSIILPVISIGIAVFPPNVFQLLKISNMLTLPVNMVLCLGIPLIMCAVGKIRRKI